VWVGVRRVVERTGYVRPSKAQKMPTDWKERKRGLKKKRKNKEELIIKEKMRVIDDQF
jgi:hypothetical protein